jgi:gamma-glutamyltranspeptidase
VGEGGKPWVALGSPGGHTIVQMVPQIVMSMTGKERQSVSPAGPTRAAKGRRWESDGCHQVSARGKA